MRHIVMGSVLCLLAAAPLRAQQSEIYLDTDSVTVGDRFRMTIALGHDGSHTVLFPHRLLPDSLKKADGRFSLGDFDILGVISEGGRPWDEGGRIDSVVYEATSFAVDSASVAGVPLGLMADGDTLMGATPPFAIPIVSLIGPDDRSIRDLKPLADFERSWWPWIVGILALVFVIAGLLWWRKRHAAEDEAFIPQTKPGLPPFEEALERLRALEQVNLKQTENIKPFYIELTDILRTYVARRTDVPALESTTHELFLRLEKMPAAHIVPSQVLTEIHRILDDADLVKFADWKPVPDSADSVVRQTREAILGTEEAYREEVSRHTEAPMPGGTDGGNDSVMPGGDGASGPGQESDWSSLPEGAWPRKDESNGGGEP